MKLKKDFLPIWIQVKIKIFWKRFFNLDQIEEKFHPIFILSLIQIIFSYHLIHFSGSKIEKYTSEYNWIMHHEID